MSDTPHPTISQLIKRLESIREKHGDLECVYEMCGAPFLPWVREYNGKAVCDLVGEGVYPWNEDEE